MHRLQQQILYALATNKRLRYARLKPEDVEGNAFMYHLRSLTKLGYIAHADEWYHLTPEGQLFIDQVSLKTFEPRVQPKIVILMVAQNDSGQILLYRRQRQPLINKVGLPYGKLHADETIYEAAARELYKKTGYTGTFNYMSSGTMKIFEDGEMTSYILYTILKVTEISGDMLGTASSGTPFWSGINAIEQTELIPSVKDILNLGHAEGKNVFVELEYRL